MNPSTPDHPAQQTSTLHLDIRIEEAWIERYVAVQNVTVPVNEKYQLTHLAFRLHPGKLTVQGEIKDKPGSVIEMNCVPKWDSSLQKIIFEDLQIHTKSKNLLVKGAGWFAQTFLQNKIDAKLEQATQALYAHYMELVKSKPLNIPFPNGGRANMDIVEINLRAMMFLENALEVKATVRGIWRLELV